MEYTAIYAVTGGTVTAIVIGVCVILLAVWGWSRITSYVFSRLEYSRRFTDEGAFEGEGAVLEEYIVNPTPFPIFFVDAEAYVYSELEFADYIPDTDKNMQYMVSRFTVMPYMKVRRKHNINCIKRGYYHLETVNLWKGKRNRYVSSEAELYVYPRMIESGLAKSPLSYLQGNELSARRLIADPFSFAGIRDYRFGDSFSSVNFKATAKTPFSGYGSIKVNDREFSSNRSLTVYINFQTDPEQVIPTRTYRKLMEDSISFASALVFEAMREGYRVGLCSNSRSIDGSESLRIPMESGNEHYIEMLKALAMMRTERGASVLSLFEADLNEWKSETEFYLITTFVSDEMAEKIGALEKNTNTVNLIKLEVIPEGE